MKCMTRLIPVLSDQRIAAMGLNVNSGDVPKLSHPEVIADFLAKPASSLAA
jgi:hypothetical protein